MDSRMETFIIIDLEATCWCSGSSPDQMEVIEIGAVRLITPAWGTYGAFQRFVRPVDEPLLSDFCRELTSITQEDVDGAETFPEVLREFLEWAGPNPFSWCSWGAYDLGQLRTDCSRYGLEWPPALGRHLNLKKLYSEQVGCRPQGMKGALRRLGLPLSGTHHRALDDARNIARIAQLVLPPLFPSAQD